MPNSASTPRPPRGHSVPYQSRFTAGRRMNVGGFEAPDSTLMGGGIQATGSVHGDQPNHHFRRSHGRTLVHNSGAGPITTLRGSLRANSFDFHHVLSIKVPNLWRAFDVSVVSDGGTVVAASLFASSVA